MALGTWSVDVNDFFHTQIFPKTGHMVGDVAGLPVAASELPVALPIL